MNSDQHRTNGNLSSFVTGTVEFLEGLSGITNLDALAEKSVNHIAELLRPEYVSLMVFNNVNHELLMDKHSGPVFKRTLTPQVKRCVDVYTSIAEGGEVLAAPENSSETFIMLYDPDQAHHCEIRIPFFVKNLYIGVLSLGKPGTGMDYSVEIIDMLRIIARHLATVCQVVYLQSNGDSETGHKNATEIVTQVKPGYQPFIRVKGKDDYDEIIGHAAGIIHVKEMISRVAPEKVPVLITGESGTGKELVARSIHNQSPRADKPLVTMNCAAMPENLVESELFGHEKGAFTGATSMNKGKFEFAHQSTLFLDEIGDMNLQTQAKLLRVLQDGKFQRIGSNDTIYADVRLIAATNKDLDKAIEIGEFREDLYYRINVFQVGMPALRERGSDIIILAETFLQMFNDRYQKQITGFDASVLDWMQNYPFPGNVRELRNIIERAVIMTQNSHIALDFMPDTARTHGNIQTHAKQSLDALEKEHIISVLQQVNNNKSAAARVLGIARKTLREKIQKYNIQL